jgi:Spy/CpxP family protein refolding chaperone
MFQNNNLGAFAIVGLILLNTVLLVMLLKKPDAPAVVNNNNEHGPIMGPDGEGPRRWMEQQLGFTPEQVKEFGMLVEDHRYNMQALRDSIAGKREELSKLLMTDSASTEAGNNIAAEIGSLQSQLEMVNFDHFTKLRAMCTAEQKPKFDSIIVEVAGAIAKDGPRNGPPQGPPPGGPEGHHPPR